MVAVVYTSLVALVQNDMKKLIAYSSVAHMAFVTGGLFAFNVQGLEGAMVMMLSHGLVSARCSFASASSTTGCTPARSRVTAASRSTCPIMRCSSCCSPWPASACRGRAALSASFWRWLGCITSTWASFVICTTGIILGAAYMLWLYRRVAFGGQTNEDAAAMPDISAREWLMMAPIAAAVLWMGVYPESFLAPMRADIAVLDARLAAAAPASDAQLAPGTPRAGAANAMPHHEKAEHEGAKEGAH
jgi:NADH-quinone oxidoreductase subunit M